MKEIKIKGLDETVYYEEMDNGLPVYMLVNKHVNSFYITFSVKYGSVHTEFVNNKGEDVKVHDGVAHFLEHVNFNEKDGFTAHDYFKNIGSNINAFTTFDFTCYEVVGTSKFKKNLIHLLDYVQTPYFTKDLIEKEKGIIVEEVKMGKNNPGHKMYYGMNKCLFKKDKRRNFVTGDEDDVLNTSVEELQNVYETFYHPKNMFLIITGNFDVDDALRTIRENQNSKKFIDYREPVVKMEEEPIEVNKEYEEIEANVEIPKLKISYKMPISLFTGYDRPTLGTYFNMICKCNFGSISEFRAELLKDELVNSIGATADIFNDVVTFDVNIDTRVPYEVIDKVKDKMNHVEISLDDLIRRKRCNIANLIKEYDDIEYTNSDMAYQLVSYGKIIDDYFEIFNNANMKDAKEILSRLDLSHSSTVLLVPFKKEQ